MEKLPAELIAEIADWTLTSAGGGKRSVSSLSLTSRRIRHNTLPTLCRSISLRDGLGVAKSQVRALCQSGMAGNIQHLSVGIASFIPKGMIDAITKEATLISSLSGLAHNERNYSYEDHIRPSIDWSSHTPSIIDSSILTKLFNVCANRLVSLSFRSITALGTNLVDDDGYDTGGGTAGKYGRDYIYLSLKPFEGVFLRGVAEVVDKYAWNSLEGVEFKLWSASSIDPLLDFVTAAGKKKKKKGKSSGPVSLLQKARKVTLGAAHTCATGERGEEVNSHEAALSAIHRLSELSPGNPPATAAGRLTSVHLSLTKALGLNSPSPSNPSGILGLPTFTNLISLSFDDTLLFGSDLESTIISSPSLLCLKLEYVDIHNHYVPSPSSNRFVRSVYDDPNDDPNSPTWESVFTVCSEYLDMLREAEVNGCGYWDSFGGDEVGLAHRASEYSRGAGVRGGMVYSGRKGDYVALRGLLEGVEGRRM